MGLVLAFSKSVQTEPEACLGPRTRPYGEINTMTSLKSA